MAIVCDNDLASFCLKLDKSGIRVRTLSVLNNKANKANKNIPSCPYPWDLRMFGLHQQQLNDTEKGRLEQIGAKNFKD